MSDWYTKSIHASSNKDVTMYHIGPGYPQPVPYHRDKGDDTGWMRGFKTFKKDEKVVFLSPDFTGVWNNHGRRGNVYIFKVPYWVIKESGGVHRFDNASELIVPEHLWKDVEFKGKMNKERANQFARDARLPYEPYGYGGKADIPDVKVGSLVRWMDSPDRGYKRESVFQVTDIKQNTATISYLGEMTRPYSWNLKTKKYNRQDKIEKSIQGVPGTETATLQHLTVDTEAQVIQQGNQG
jgi:hypothetical protein